MFIYETRAYIDIKAGNDIHHYLPYHFIFPIYHVTYAGACLFASSIPSTRPE